MAEIWDLIVGNFVGALIILGRVSGIFTFNPILARANAPAMTRVMMSVVLTAVMLASMGGTTGYVPGSLIELVFVVIKEALLGLMFGLFVNLMLTVLIIAGEMADNQVGLTMAKTMDPGTNIQMPVFANFFNYLFILYFFITGGHLEYIRLFALSYDIIPAGFALTVNTAHALYDIVLYFGTIMVLGLKLSMPLIAAELMVEFCIGVIMKAVPTIQVFVINIQFKIFIGLIILLAITTPISDFLERLFGYMWSGLDHIKDVAI
ncbi:MAG: flagellar biosynthetic protein FliR [Oscillospiraceae bacterium]|jgi:flagellar biosynthetic protein FliR|nr:flagellar biosynthetic protein FliR [Oscillospiraceae bacterium]